MADPTSYQAAAHFLLNERQAGRPFAPIPEPHTPHRILRTPMPCRRSFQKLLTEDLWFNCRV